MIARPVPDSDAVRRRVLSNYFAEVVAARHWERSQSLRSRGSEDLDRARTRTLRALVDYADLIDSLGWPVPRVIHADIALRRSLYGPRLRRPERQPTGP